MFRVEFRPRPRWVDVSKLALVGCLRICSSSLVILQATSVRLNGPSLTLMTGRRSRTPLKRSRMASDRGAKLVRCIQGYSLVLRSVSTACHIIEDHHGIVGSTTLPRTLTALLATTRGGSNGPAEAQIPQASAKSAAYEILRIGANICMDHGTLPRVLRSSSPWWELRLPSRTVSVDSDPHSGPP